MTHSVTRERAPSGLTADPSAAGSRVLVVDDDPAVHYLVDQALSAAGFSVTGARSGADALSAILSDPPDIVLLDVAMPGIDGFETCRRLRAMPGALDLPVVMVTGSDDLASIRSAYEAGATDFLTKPIHWLILEQRIRYILKASSAFQELRRTAHALTERTEELEAANNAALASARFKTEILNNVSHELRTPLNGILGMTAMALETPLNKDQREFLLSTEDCAKELLRIVADLLDCAQIEAGRLALTPTRFDLRELVHGTIDLLRSGAEAKGLEMSARIASDVPETLVGDRGRLRQVLVNLLGNAIKFTETGSIDVAVGRIAPSRNDSVKISFAVADTGVGIPKHSHELIFEAFRQMDGSTTRPYGGTGLGLSVARQLVRLMNGEILVESQLGRGSTFSFVLDFESDGTNRRGGSDDNDGRS